MNQTLFALAASTVAAIMVSTSVRAQTPTPPPMQKKIDVTGSAEMEVTPDEIYFSISLREYQKDNKTKVDIQTLEKQLQAAVKSANIPKEDFQIENIAGNRWQWPPKKKPTDFLESKQYVLKLGDLANVDEILSKVDAKGIEYVNVTRYEHSKIDEYRRDLKIKALQAAKEKADYLLKAIGEQAGTVMEVQELGGTDGDFPVPYPRVANYAMAKMESDAMPAEEPAIDFKKIKLRYEMRAVFAIK